MGDLDRLRIMEALCKYFFALIGYDQFITYSVKDRSMFVNLRVHADIGVETRARPAQLITYNSTPDGIMSSNVCVIIASALPWLFFDPFYLLCYSHL